MSTTNYRMHVSCEGSVALTGWRVANGGTRTGTAQFRGSNSINSGFRFVQGVILQDVALVPDNNVQFTNLPTVYVKVSDSSLDTPNKLKAASVNSGTCYLSSVSFNTGSNASFTKRDATFEYEVEGYNYERKFVYNVAGSESSTYSEYGVDGKHVSGDPVSKECTVAAGYHLLGG